MPTWFIIYEELCGNKSGVILKILIVDDDEYFLAQLKELLELDNHVISTTPSSLEALQIINKTPIDLVLTDLKMPDLTGLEFLIQARNNGNSSVFIILTGFGTIESAVDAVKASAYDYLMKPFEFSILKAKVREVEKNLRLQGKSNVRHIINDSEVIEYFDTNRIRADFKPPFLVISDKNPKLLVPDDNFNQTTPIWFKLKSDVTNDSKSKATILSLELKIEDFIRNNSEGSIIFQGIEKISQKYSWGRVREFIINIQTKISVSNVNLLILTEMTDQLNPVFRLLSFFGGSAFNKIIEIISHPIRKNIIFTLNSHYKASFKTLSEELSIESSSVLSFHLKKLINEKIITKETHLDPPQYSLTFKGDYLSEIITILDKMGSQGPFSSIKLGRRTAIKDRDGDLIVQHVRRP